MEDKLCFRVIMPPRVSEINHHLQTHKQEVQPCVQPTLNLDQCVE